jgi:hypothetical protein
MVETIDLLIHHCVEEYRGKLELGKEDGDPTDEE